MRPLTTIFSFFFFNDTATTEIYTLSLHDALPIYFVGRAAIVRLPICGVAILIRIKIFLRLAGNDFPHAPKKYFYRSEEHTSELQSHLNLVCRLLLEKKKNK